MKRACEACCFIFILTSCFTSGADETKPVLLGAKGLVYDVTAGKDFYGPGGPYAVFAGSDATVALAKMKVDEAHVNVPNPSAGLTLSEKDILNDWVTKFEQKYKVVGRLVGTGEAN
jgi:membrane-associated progesterone receptor component